MTLPAHVLGEKDGARLLKRKGPFCLEQRCAVAAESGRAHLRQVEAGRVAIDEVAVYCTAFLRAAMPAEKSGAP